MRGGSIATGGNAQAAVQSWVGWIRPAGRPSNQTVMKELNLLNTIVIVITGLIAAPIICSAAIAPLINYAQLESLVVNHLNDALASGEGIAKIVLSNHCEC